MPFTLLSSDRRPQPVTGTDDPLAIGTAGPAVILADPSVRAEAAAPPALAARPWAYRREGGRWCELDDEATRHWSALSEQLRGRLLADSTAPLTVDEFKATTDGASASMITNNWVHSGTPREYRVAGRLREFIEVLSSLSGSDLR